MVDLIGKNDQLFMFAISKNKTVNKIIGFEHTFYVLLRTI